MNGFDKRRAQKEKRIIDTALELFMQLDFKEVSVSEIARKAGVSQVTIFKYFETKSKLIRQCVIVLFKTKADEYRKMLSNGLPYLERLKDVMSYKNAQWVGVVGGIINRLEEQDPEFIEELLKVRRETIVAVLKLFFEEGRNLGIILSNLDDEAIIAFLDVLSIGLIKSTYYNEFRQLNPRAFEILQQMATFSLVSRSYRIPQD